MALVLIQNEWLLHVLSIASSLTSSNLKNDHTAEARGSSIFRQRPSWSCTVAITSASQSKISVSLLSSHKCALLDWVYSLFNRPKVPAATNGYTLCNSVSSNPAIVPKSSWWPWAWSAGSRSGAHSRSRWAWGSHSISWTQYSNTPRVRAHIFPS